MRDMHVKSPRKVVTESCHPLVRAHPETGRKLLYVCSHTQRFEGMSDAESKPLLDWLREHARPVLCYRFRRQPGSLAFRDNRCIRHHPVDDNRGERRVKHRVTIYGDTPFRMRGAADSAPHPFPSQERRMPAPAPGVPAPEFTLPNQDGKLVSLSDHAGKPVLVWFFSRAFGSN